MKPLIPLAHATALFAGGCFWGIEDAFRHVPGVLDVSSGYTGGHTVDPTYTEVCTGRTGHAESVRVHFDPERISYEALARIFFELHDPTQLDRQGPDMGTQYRSALFYMDDNQKNTAETLIGELRAKGWDVVTQLAPAAAFYPAEPEHQGFVARTGRGGCHLRVSRFAQKPNMR